MSSNRMNMVKRGALLALLCCASLASPSIGQLTTRTPAPSRTLAPAPAPASVSFASTPTSGATVRPIGAAPAPAPASNATAAIPLCVLNSQGNCVANTDYWKAGSFKCFSVLSSTTASPSTSIYFLFDTGLQNLTLSSSAQSQCANAGCNVTKLQVGKNTVSHCAPDDVQPDVLKQGQATCAAISDRNSCIGSTGNCTWLDVTTSSDPDKGSCVLRPNTALLYASNFNATAANDLFSVHAACVASGAKNESACSAAGRTFVANPPPSSSLHSGAFALHSTVLSGVMALAATLSLLLLL